MKPSGIITLITDFGAGDWYAGVMKGVILCLNPAAAVVDITHCIPRGDAVCAAIALRASFRFFPPGTVHAVVVDPGVGSDREILCAAAGGHIFLVPDNGILHMAHPPGTLAGVRALRSPALRLPRVSATFHGRDVIAPAAAHLSKGAPPARFGPLCRPAVIRRLPVPVRISSRRVKAEVLYADAFGNLITSVPEEAPLLRAADKVAILIAGREIRGLSRCYAAVPEGGLLAIIGSSGYLEIAVNGGSAADALGACRGTPLIVAAAAEAHRNKPQIETQTGLSGRR